MNDIPEPHREVLTRYLHGELPANVALMQLIANSASRGKLQHAVLALQRASSGGAAGCVRDRATELATLWRETPQAWQIVKSVLQSVTARRADMPSANVAAAIAYWADMFDRASDCHADAGAALYALGSQDLLASATEEVLSRLAEWNVLSNLGTVLEIGCGTGRFVARFAATARVTIGIDTSPGMLRRAADRCRNLAGALLVQTGGQDLAVFRNSSFDLVLAIDSFPYIVAAGGFLAETHMREAARVLRAGGHFVILNYSYRNNAAADSADIASFASKNHFSVIRNGTRDFARWDGRAYVLKRQ